MGGNMSKAKVIVFSLKQMLLGVWSLMKISAELIILCICAHVAWSIAVSDHIDFSRILIRSSEYIFNQYLNLFTITAFNVSLLSFLLLIVFVNVFSLLFDKKAVETVQHLEND